ncbi:MAG: NAD(P)H-hydrate dehydratase [Chlorobium sp.]|uniref:NAD(P)H-hydrate dehydratase n=1 Tax=Chlorobium sp. TaxID=1095 RepID=UPI0025BB7549|nr:NAD(P)H-hydrate dehydratase [Chlorobium sp.]MCF8382395.1 NAD(P)H-hydrate dehydratase [Chlorobium sp.]
MLPVVTADGMAKADRAALEDLHIGESRLMELAGVRTVDRIRTLLDREDLQGAIFLVVAGKGNNGGDGLVVARHLLNRGAGVDLLLLYPDEALSPVNRNGLEILYACRDLYDMPLRLFRETDEALPFVMERQYDGLVDAVLGTGLKIDEPRKRLLPPAGEGIDLLNSIRQRTGSPLIAVDIPSGLDATSGFTAEQAVQADMTVSMAFLKTGFFFNEGPRLCGELQTAEISIPEFLLDSRTCRLTDREYAAAQYMLREPSGAKHQNGKVLIIAGSHSLESSMLGAALLSVKAAIRTGAGYVCAAMPIAGAAVLHSFAPEAVVISQEMDAILEKALWADAVLIGCGLGRKPETVSFIRELLRKPEIIARKLVIDADALFALKESDFGESGIDFSNTLLTPHYGEFSRLSGLAAELIASDPLGLAAGFAGRNGVNLLLKGHPTVLAGTAGELFLNDSGTEALSTAGSGDLLAGMIAAIAAKGADILDAGAAAAWFHGRAGDLADEVSSLVSAGGILDAIPAAIHEIFDIEE